MMQHNTGYNRAPCKMQEVSKACWGNLRWSKFATWKNKALGEYGVDIPGWEITVSEGEISKRLSLTE